MVTKLQIEHWDNNSKVKILRPREKRFRTPTVKSRRIAISMAQKLSFEPVFSSQRTTTKQSCLVSQPMHLEHYLFSK